MPVAQVKTTKTSESCPQFNDCSLERRRVSPFFSLSQKIENLSHDHPLLAGAYYNIFYRRMLERELDMANLRPGAKVIHIGSGPYPYTAIFLAEQGYTVEGWDCDYHAVKKGGLLVKKLNLDDRIKIKNCEGSEITDPDCDAIWVSLNICPKEKVLQNAFRALDEGAVLAYRNLPRMLSKNYREVAADSWPAGQLVCTAKSTLGSESIVVKKGSSVPASH